MWENRNELDSQALAKGIVLDRSQTKKTQLKKPANSASYSPVYDLYLDHNAYKNIGDTNPQQHNPEAMIFIILESQAIEINLI